MSPFIRLSLSSPVAGTSSSSGSPMGGHLASETAQPWKPPALHTPAVHMHAAEFGVHSTNQSALQLRSEITMKEWEGLRDRVEIEALRAEFTDAAMMNDHVRLASLFVREGSVRIPAAGVEAAGRDSIRAFAQQREERFEVFVQTTHPGVVAVAGDTATGRAYVSELIRMNDGASHLNYAIYHDRYQRTPDGWRFTERVYEIRYVDTTPLAGGPGG